MAKSSTASRNKKVGDLFSTFINGLVFLLLPFWPKRRTTMLAILSEKIVPIFYNQVTPSESIKFWCFGGWPSYRAQSATNKEKATIEWIDSFEDGSVFWDIGANVGVFSLYAAKTKKRLNILAFEPSASNFAVFVKNIELNEADNIITPMLIALSSKTQLDYLHMQTNEPGNTGAQFGQKAPTKGFKQGILGYSADDFVAQFKTPIPNYIKIDVDGLEKEILLGAEKILKNKNVKSIAIELTAGSSEQVKADQILTSYNFKLEKSQDTVQGKSSVQNYFYYR